MRFFTNALCVFSLMSPAWGVDFTGSGNPSIVNISTNVPLTTTAGNQQYLLNLHANTNNNDNLRAFVNRKAGGALDWLSAEWYLGRYVDVTNMFQLVWGLDPQGMNFRIGRGYPATSDFLINGNGSVIIGTDPGGAALLRVGGVGYLSNGTSRLTLDPNQVTLDSGSPALQFFENDAGVDGKRWKFQANGGSFTGFTANDSDTVAAQWLNVQRSVNSIFKTTINPNGGAMIVGSDPGGGEALRVGGAVRLGSSLTSRGAVFVEGGVATGMMQIEGRFLEIGAGQTSDQHTFIDFHGSESAFPDYSSRIARDPGANANFGFYNRGLGQTIIAAQDAGTIGLWTNGAERVRVNPTGNVGIGSTNPKALIQISRNGYAAIGLGEDDANVFYMTKETTDNSFNIWRGAFGSSANLLKIAATGNVGIGTSNPQSKLAVNGTITAKEVVVTLNGWSDHVFAADYRLAPLSEVAEHIESKRHLPGIPSEAEILDKGLSMGEMQRLHMAKIEELTLYAIQADKELRISQAKAEANAQLQATTQAEVRRLTQENKIMAERLERIERVLLARDHASEVSP